MNKFSSRIVIEDILGDAWLGGCPEYLRFLVLEIRNDSERIRQELCTIRPGISEFFLFFLFRATRETLEIQKGLNNLFLA